MTTSILLIKHGALGDLIQATAAFKAVRQAHPEAHLIGLTRAAFASVLKDWPWLDEVWTDPVPKPWQPRTIWQFRRQLRAAGITRVYDLQCSERTHWLYRLWPRPKPAWVGAVPQASHSIPEMHAKTRHTLDRQQAMMHRLDLRPMPSPSLPYPPADLSRFDLPAEFALLVPGAAPTRPAKRWPVSYYAEVARVLDHHGVQPVVVGGKGEHSLGQMIESKVPGARNLTGHTTLAELQSLAAHARMVVGNDTGPMHLAAVAGASCIVLFSYDSDPELCAPRGENVRILRRHPLSALPPAEVIAKLPLAG